MKHFLLFYDFVPDYAQRRPAFREEHLRLGWQSFERGELVLAGALDPLDTGVLLFKTDAPEVVEAFARADPYVKNGLVTKWSVRPWVTVVGDTAATPVKPKL